MIRRPTVLVLGAGASMKFGFPSGGQLFTQIAMADGEGDNSMLVNHLHRLGIPKEDVRSFSAALRRSGRQSVDAFLEHRSDFLEIGKLVMAYSLIPHESEERLFPSDGGTLYHHLFQALNAPLDRFHENRLTIVTFNYDRSFEHFLTTALAHAYNVPLAEAAIAARGIPVLHLHGSLGSYTEGDRSFRSYSPHLDLSSVRKAANEMVVIHEAVPDSPAFRAARQALSSASRVLFLGFSYGRLNVGRLLANVDREGRTYSGSTYGLESAERQSAANLFDGRISLDPQGRDLVVFLRDQPALDS